MLNSSVQLPARSDMFPGLYRDQSPGVQQDQDSPSRNAAKGKLIVKSLNSDLNSFKYNVK